MNVGRVMTPTLGMAVMREAAISAFRSEPFYTVQLGFPEFAATGERLKEKRLAEELAKKCRDSSTTLDGTRKFKNFWLSGIALQRVSDLICLENGLSVIERKFYRDRKKRTEYPKKETFRDSICAAIDVW